MSDTTSEVRVPDLLTVMEAGTVARISRTTAYDLANQFLATSGAVGLPVKRVGSQLRVPRRQFEEWIGTPITTWPPVVDDIAATVIAVNDTANTVPSINTSSRTTSSTSRTTTPPQLFSV